MKATMHFITVSQAISTRAVSIVYKAVPDFIVKYTIYPRSQNKTRESRREFDLIETASECSCQ